MHNGCPSVLRYAKQACKIPTNMLYVVPWYIHIISVNLTANVTHITRGYRRIEYAMAHLNLYQ